MKLLGRFAKNKAGKIMSDIAFSKVNYVLSIALAGLLWIVLPALAPSVAAAQQPGAARTVPWRTSRIADAVQAGSGKQVETGNSSRSRSLLELQRQGTQASENNQYLTGAEKVRVYQRYLDSFTHAIPEQLTETGFGPDE